MDFTRIFLPVIVFCFAIMSIRCELLVVQHGPDGLAPLSNRNGAKYGQAIFETMLKYQWPTCTSQDLTDQEKEELLTAGKPCAEEQFVQKKLQEKIGQAELNLNVLYIPTALYELFCICQFFKNEDSVLHKKFRTLIREANRSPYQTIDLEPILNQDADPAIISQQVHEAYQSVNEPFFNGTNSPRLQINQEFVSFLFELYPELTRCRDPLAASEIIQEKSQNLTAKLIHELVELEDTIDKSKSIGYRETSKILGILSDLAQEKQTGIVKQVVEHEYKARYENKALIMRGSSCQKFKTGFDDKAIEQMLVGSTIRSYQCKDVLDEKGRWKDCNEISLLRAYQEQIIRPYSIAFGNSLFAGFLNDNGACAYRFLNGRRVYKETSESEGNIAGYSLFIDKKKYMQDRNSDLFFIPPLAPIVAVASNGEYFHPRAIAATSIKTDKPQRVSGIFITNLKDPANVLLIKRDPLEHAAIFSAFLAKNGKIIQRGKDQDLTEEDKEFAKNVLEQQAKAAELYQKMKSDAQNMSRHG